MFLIPDKIDHLKKILIFYSCSFPIFLLCICGDVCVFFLSFVKKFIKDAKLLSHCQYFSSFVLCIIL